MTSAASAPKVKLSRREGAIPPLCGGHDNLIFLEYESMLYMIIIKY